MSNWDKFTKKEVRSEHKDSVFRAADELLGKKKQKRSILPWIWTPALGGAFVFFLVVTIFYTDSLPFYTSTRLDSEDIELLENFELINNLDLLEDIQDVEDIYEEEYY